MPVSPARSAAFDILLRVERDHSYASELLHSAMCGKLSPADHGLATELVMGVLRWRSRLDAGIAAASSQPLKKLDVEILIALRLALYQFLWLDRIPERAALHESVELVKRARKRSAAPFVNAVLRKLSAPTPLPSPGMSSPESIAAALAHPLWLVDRWSQEYGLAVAQRICEYDQAPPATSIRLRTPAAAEILTLAGVSLAPAALLGSARHVQSGDVTQTAAFQQKQIVIQDEGSQLVAALIGQTDHEGSRILDCCAAPGGKTLAMADRNPSASITALELHPHRARLMRKLLEGNPSMHIDTVIGDARTFPASHPFDRVLADVPCSGTGTLARNPEIKWSLQPADLSDLHDRQLAILRAAIGHLAPAGRLVYSTCSLEKEENENVVEQALAENNGVRLLSCQEELECLKAAGELIWPDLSSLTRGPYLRTIPGVHPCDGFFAALIEKK